MMALRYGDPKKKFLEHKPLDEIIDTPYTVLDVTAGYRYIWFTKKLPYLGKTLFLDVRREVSPDVVADNEHLPFKNNSFKIVVYEMRGIVNPNFDSSFFKTEFGKRFWAMPSRSTLLRNVYCVNFEAARVAERLIVKWCDTQVSVETLKHLLTCWKLVKQKTFRSFRAFHMSKNTTYWLFFEKKKEKMKNE